MGCSQSKIENEEAVSRCKERKAFMKSAVSARNAFAAAHCSYAMSLKNAGAALSDFAQGEVANPLSLSSVGPTSVGGGGGSGGGVGPTSIPSQPPPPPPIQTLPPPPPPDVPPPLQRAVSMPEFAAKPGSAKLVSQDTIEEHDEDEDEDEDDDDDDDEEEEEVEDEEVEKLRRRREHHKGGSVGGRLETTHTSSNSGFTHANTNSNTTSTNTTTTTSASNSVVGPPPSLPPEERERRTPPPPPLPEVHDRTWDYFFNTEDMPGGSLRDDDDEMRREYVERTVYHQRHMRSSTGTPVSVTTAAPPSIEVVEEMMMPERQMAMSDKPPLPGGGGGRVVKKGKQVMGQGGSGGEGKKKNVNLVQIFGELDDCFLKTSESAHLVSKMLEATRLHYHSNFADNRGHIDHSARVMRVITWNRSFRGLANADEYKDDFDSEENETHATVLDKLLAWEKKLYDEVKAGEIMKFEYQRKVASLHKQKKRGTNSDSLEKTKAAVSHLHTRYIVDMQSMDSTVSEISRLRDEQLYPKLVALVDAMATMWEVMQVHHENQLKIATALRLVDISQSAKETTDQHHERTIQLWAIVQEWHSHFDKMVNHQKEYIRALSSWLKLNLIPIESNLKEKVSSPPRAQKPPIQDLLLAWLDHLEKLPDEHAKSAIYNLEAVLHTIVQQQDDEMRQRAKAEESRRDLEKKQRQYNKWVNEYMQKRMPTDDVDPTSMEDGVHKDEMMVEKEFVVENAKKKLEDDTESYERQCIQVREKTLASLKTRLPELFRALSEFAVAATDMYSNLKSLCHSSQSRKHKETATA
ncbi:Nitrate regulatory gene2 protein [Bienertia sinuspersici]